MFYILCLLMNITNNYIKQFYILINMNNYSIPLECSHVKIDIGLSYGANQSSNWLDTENDVMVFGFEPNPESYNCLLNGNISLRDPSHAWAGKPLDKKHIDSGRMCIFNVALSNVENMEELDFYVNSKDCGTSSLYSHDQQYLGPIAKVIKVPVYSLKTFFDTFPWDRFEYIDYIKIDAQGSDLNILKGASTYLSEKVVYVTAEPDGNQYFGAHDCNIDNITNYMVSQNFLKINHPNTSDPTFINTKFLHLQDKIYISQK
jgi:FkbM family methyltransferase